MFNPLNILAIPSLNLIVLFYHWIGNFGIAFALYTICVQFIISPLTLYGALAIRHTNRTTKALRPELLALQKKYGSDKKRIKAETRALFKAHKVRPPLGIFSMLPTILFLIVTLYTSLNFLINDASHPQPTTINQLLFPFIPRLTQPMDTLFVGPGGYSLDFTQVESGTIHIFALITAILGFIQVKMTMAREEIPVGESGFKRPHFLLRNGVAIFIALFSISSFWTAPAASMPFYWTISSIILITLQYFVNGRNFWLLAPPLKIQPTQDVAQAETLVSLPVADAPLPPKKQTPVRKIAPSPQSLLSLPVDKVLPSSKKQTSARKIAPSPQSRLSLPVDKPSKKQTPANKIAPLPQSRLSLPVGKVLPLSKKQTSARKIAPSPQPRLSLPVDKPSKKQTPANKIAPSPQPRPKSPLKEAGEQAKPSPKTPKRNSQGAHTKKPKRRNSQPTSQANARGKSRNGQTRLQTKLKKRNAQVKLALKSR